MFDLKGDSIYKQIYREIKAFDTIVIARHISPDPDAIASQIALRDSIRLTFPEKKVYAVGAGVSKFKYLGSLDKVDVKEIKDSLLIVLDVPNFIRVDNIEGLEYNALMKIDHHPSDDITGEVDWTDATKSSTCEMLINLLLNTKLEIDQKIAQNLYLGLVFDSDRFLLNNTSKETFKAVSDLLENCPIDFVSLYDNLYNKSFDDLKFYGYLINHLTITDNGFGYLKIKPEDIQKYHVDPTTPSNMVNNFYFVDGLICWCFATYDERNKIHKINIRSRGPIINDIASKYNGGGHQFASGCRITNEEDIEKLFKELDDACKKYNDAENR
jgi:bifunctional oligoribonuclease and PAP phosphatase NrnA